MPRVLPFHWLLRMSQVLGPRLRRGAYRVHGGCGEGLWLAGKAVRVLVPTILGASSPQVSRCGPGGRTTRKLEEYAVP